MNAREDRRLAAFLLPCLASPNPKLLCKNDVMARVSDAQKLHLFFSEIAGEPGGTVAINTSNRYAWDLWSAVNGE